MTTTYVSDFMFTFLAQVPSRSGSGSPVASNQVLFWVGMLLLVLLTGAVAVFLLRRKLLGLDSRVDATTGLMEAMRQMRDSGQMTQEEYEATRRSMTQRASQGMSNRASTSKPRQVDATNNTDRT